MPAQVINQNKKWKGQRMYAGPENASRTLQSTSYGCSKKSLGTRSGEICVDKPPVANSTITHTHTTDVLQPVSLCHQFEGRGMVMEKGKKEAGVIQR